MGRWRWGASGQQEESDFEQINRYMCIDGKGHAKSWIKETVREVTMVTSDWVFRKDFSEKETFWLRRGKLDTQRDKYILHRGKSTWGHWHRVAICRPRRKQTCQHLDPGLKASKTVTNKFLFFKPPSIAFVYNSPNKLMHGLFTEHYEIFLKELGLMI